MPPASKLSEQVVLSWRPRTVSLPVAWNVLTPHCVHVSVPGTMKADGGQAELYCGAAARAGGANAERASASAATRRRGILIRGEARRGREGSSF